MERRWRSQSFCFSYSGNASASFDFQRWLDAHAIPHAFDSYV